MKRSSPLSGVRGVVLLGAGLLLVPLCLVAQARPHPDPAADSSKGDTAMSAHDFQGVMERSMKDMERMAMTDDVDANFAAMMMRHHQSAIDMAKIEVQYGKNPTMRELAQKIIADQQKEIQQLKTFLEGHDRSMSTKTDSK